MRRVRRTPGAPVSASVTAVTTTALAVAATCLLAACSGGDATPSASSSPSLIGGQATCDAPTLSAAVSQDVAATYPDAKFVSLDTFTCADGWVIARAQIETSGTTVRSMFVLRAEGQAWVPTRLEDICTKPGTAPASIQREACGG